MKKTTYLLLLVPTILMMGFGKLENGSLTDTERSKAIEYLKTTQQDIMDAVKGLSEEQLNFKASAESWSVAECVEHIAITEDNIFKMIEMSMQTEANPTKRAEVKFSDEQIFEMITDRSHKVKTKEAFVPSGKFGSYEGSIKEFKKLRKEHINYVKSTKDDLRNYYADLPFGTIDAYQIIVFLSGHSKRHMLQIQEVKNNPDFPKK